MRDEPSARLIYLTFMSCAAAMSYTDAIAQLNSLVPELYATAGQPRRRFSVDEVRILLDALATRTSIPISADCRDQWQGLDRIDLASILSEAGLRTGLYTSPHLERPNERIRLGHEEIANDDFARLYFRVHDAGQQLLLSGRLAQLPSYFEILTPWRSSTLPRTKSTSQFSRWAWADALTQPTSLILCSRSSLTFRLTTWSGSAQPSLPSRARKPESCAPANDDYFAAAS